VSVRSFLLDFNRTRILAGCAAAAGQVIDVTSVRMDRFFRIVETLCTYDDTPTVPEPAPLAILGGSLFDLSLIRRRWSCFPEHPGFRAWGAARSGAAPFRYMTDRR
jgi:hypothetical protein